MNGNSRTNIVIAIAIIIIIVLGALLLYKSMPSKDSTSQATTAGANATTTAAADQVQGQDVKVGTGSEAQPGDYVSVMYVGKFTDGTVFDSSAAHGNEPLRFQLGAQGIIPGFQIGINGMKVGGERLLAVPPALGYGSGDVKDDKGTVIIPGNSTLIFDVQLVKVEAASSTPSTSSSAPAAAKTQ